MKAGGSNNEEFDADADGFQQQEMIRHGRTTGRGNPGTGGYNNDGRGNQERGGYYASGGNPNRDGSRGGGGGGGGRYYDRENLGGRQLEGYGSYDRYTNEGQRSGGTGRGYGGR
jgi:hypothetical protein